MRKDGLRQCTRLGLHEFLHRYRERERRALGECEPDAEPRLQALERGPVQSVGPLQLEERAGAEPVVAPLLAPSLGERGVPEADVHRVG